MSQYIFNFCTTDQNIAVHKIDIYRVSIFTYACPNRQVNCDVITSVVQPTMTSSPERKHIKRTTLSMYENCPLIVTHGLIMSCKKYNYICAVLNYALNRWLIWYSYPNKHQNNPRDIDIYDLSRQNDNRPIFSQKRDLLPTCGLTQGFTYTSDMRLGVWCFFSNAVIAGIIADRRCIKNRLHIVDFLKKSLFIDEYDNGTDYICHSNWHYIRFCSSGASFLEILSVYYIYFIWEQFNPKVTQFWSSGNLMFFYVANSLYILLLSQWTACATSKCFFPWRCLFRSLHLSCQMFTNISGYSYLYP